MRRLLLGSAVFMLAMPTARAHDIPNARVDRAIQITVSSGRLAVDYEVSLAELTLTQELRGLIGHLPGAGRDDWLAAYGKETGPLNAKGLLVAVSGNEVKLEPAGFDLVVEEHPRYTFHFSAALPRSGRLRAQDTNFGSSEGTSRLAIRAVGVELSGSEVPENIDDVEARPLWMLTDDEERRTRLVEVDFASVLPSDAVSVTPTTARPRAQTAPSPEGLLALLDGEGGWPLLGLLAFFLGATHALLPGHGKSVVVAAVLGGDGGRFRGVLLAVVATVTHLASVVLLAVGLWWSLSTQFAEWDERIGRTSGFLIAAVALWRLGRHLARQPLSEHSVHLSGPGRSLSGIVPLGMAAGAVPCWDAIALVLTAEALGRLGLAFVLLASFSAGLGTVLVALGFFAASLNGRWPDPVAGWPGRLRLASHLALGGLGAYLLYRPV